MKENENYKQSIQADIALIEAKVIRFKVRAMGFTAEAKKRHEEKAERLEKKIDGIIKKLSHLEDVDEHQRMLVKDTIGKSLRELQAELEDATQTFKTEPGVSGPHGGDDGPYPYGEGLSGRSTDREIKS